MPSQLVDYGCGVVSSTPHQDWHAASGQLDYELLDLMFFFGGQARCLACGGLYTQEVGSVLELIVNESFQRGVVYFAVGGKRCYEGDAQAFENVLCHKKTYTVTICLQRYYFFLT